MRRLLKRTNLGVRGVAVPILDVADYALATVATAGPLARLPDRQLESQLACCRKATADIAAPLGLRVWSSDRFSVDD
jgi:DNA-binding IclR family transcriptional regulator